MSPRELSYLENGKHRPYPATSLRLADALGLTGEDRAVFLTTVETPAVADVTAASTHLPSEPTPFIGRKREVDVAIDLLQQSDVRMLTLAGPGGIGKTRLALRVGSRLADRFKDGIAFVPLAGVHSPDLVPGAIAGTLAVPDMRGSPAVDVLTEYLRERDLLLILDNYEHLVDGGQIVAGLLSACSHLRVLVTSRTVLHLTAEHVLAVPPLATPEPGTLCGTTELVRYDAVALFVTRARARQADFVLTAENAGAVVDICRQLDGLPLAIELAAARVALFSPPALLSRLSHRLPLLTGGARDLPERQQTLRSTIDWSYQLLSAPERILFARVSVFEGGCTFGAVEAICMPGEATTAVLEGMTSLVDQSLVRQVESRAGEPRLAMLETIREFARERLIEAREEEEVRRRHAEYFVQIAEQIDADWMTRWLNGLPSTWYPAQLGEEEDNLWAALAWAVEREEAVLGLRLAPVLTHGWHDPTWWARLHAHLESLLALDAPVPPTVRARALRTAAVTAVDQGEMLTRFDEAIALHRQSGDREGLLYALTWLTGPGRTDALEKQEGHNREALALARELRADGAIGMSLRGFGFSAQIRGDLDGARAFFEESLAVEQARSHHLGVAWSRHALAWLSLLEGQLAQAQELAAACESAYRTAESFVDLANLQALRAIGAFLQGDYTALYTRFHQGSRDPRLTWIDRLISQWLYLLAAARSAEGAAEEAALLLGAADRGRDRTEDTALAPFRALIAQQFASGRSQLGVVAWQTAWDRGRGMTLQEAWAHAMDSVPSPETQL